MASLAWNRHGKAQIRLLRLRRERDPHEVADLTISIQLEGAFDRVYTAGDNAACLATDSMKNTVYAFAREDPIASIEAFALKLADHFVRQGPVTCASVSIAEHPWDRVQSRDGAAFPHAFAAGRGDDWTAMVTRDAAGPRLQAGLTGLVLLKTTDSAFSGFPRDRFTTLPDTEDRLLATSMTASWIYAPPFPDFGVRHRIRAALVETFAGHQSRSVQHTLYAMAEAALGACAEVTEITVSMPNRHHLLVDLAPFGLDNPGEVFTPTEQPFGLIEATVRRFLGV